MSATQFFPIPPAHLARAGETVSRQVSRLPFQRNGVMITTELIGVTLESLNAEPTRTLPLLTPGQGPLTGREGLDRVLEERLKIRGKVVAPVIAEVLESAGIAEPFSVLDHDIRQSRRGIRLLSPWAWHLVSADTLSVHDVMGGSGTSPEPRWMSLCPVCRAGALRKIIGKQLFGIPRTDFIIECGSCGAKFIPVGPAYRLVSIATIRDPLWKKHLDTTRTAEEWAALARGPGESKTVSLTKKDKPDRTVISTESKILPVANDGSLVVQVEGKIFYFRPAVIRFSGTARDELWARSTIVLNDLLRDPVFSHLRDQVLARYSNYLPLTTGVFLHQLKERHDTFYQEFLNPYGDEKYSLFRFGDTPGIEKPGVLVTVVNRSCYHAVACPQSVGGMINDTFGRITPDLCLLTGDATRCRINSVISTHRSESGFYYYSSGDPGEREKIIQSLAGSKSAR